MKKSLTAIYLLTHFLTSTSKLIIMNTQTKKDTTYNGWKNYQTWNVALWIGNDEGLYNMAVDYMRNVYKGKSRAIYKLFCNYAGLTGGRTQDNVAWTGTRLDYKRLNEMMKEFK